MADSSVLEDTNLDTITDNGDHDKFSHYVRKEDILKSQVEGIPAKALCGKQWYPNSDPEKYGICPSCKDIYDSMEILNDRY